MIQFLNSADDVQWLKDTHLKNWGEKDKVGSFILEGNEDYPTRLTIYTQQNPVVSDEPLAILIPDDIRGWDIPHRV